MRAPRRARSRPFTRSQCTNAPRRPRRVVKPAASMSTTDSNVAESRSRYGHARRSSSSRGPVSHSRQATSPTMCWASTSSGCSTGAKRSNSPRRTASISAAHSTRSSRLSGNRRPLGVASTPWPERPTRCRKVDTARVEPSWQTRSTSPMSMPSSSEAVATRTVSEPALSRCSACRRRSRDRLPWWEATAPSPSRSASASAARSTRRRVLANTSVVRWARASSAIRSYTSAHTSADMTGSSGEAGTSSARSRAR